MSEDLQKKVDDLTKENEQLKQQMAQNSQGVENLLLQLEAHKSQLNESMMIGLNLRANILGLQKQGKQVVEHAQALQKQLDEAKKKIADLEGSASKEAA